MTAYEINYWQPRPPQIPPPAIVIYNSYEEQRIRDEMNKAKIKDRLELAFGKFSVMEGVNELRKNISCDICTLIINYTGFEEPGELGLSKVMFANEVKNNAIDIPWQEFKKVLKMSNARTSKSVYLEFIKNIKTIPKHKKSNIPKDIPEEFENLIYNSLIEGRF